MNKKILVSLLLISFFSLSIVSSLDSNEEIICDYSEQFLREHIIPDGFDYSQEEIVNLTSLINVYLSPDIQIGTVELYLKNFEFQCGRSNPTFLEIKEPSNFTIVKINTENFTNNGQINKELEFNFGLFVLKFDMDWYVPFFKIDLDNSSSESIGGWRYLFKYEPIADDYYQFHGFKVWWIIILFVLIIGLKIIKSQKKDERKINKLINRKPRK